MSIKKVAILGGGVGAITAALRLTEDPDWKSRYDITVYQMGWRLGGKGASGRGVYDRIEEHGLHLWLGFYDNAFRLIQEVYRQNEKNLPSDAPLRTWDQAFKQHSFICVEEHIADQWKLWSVDFLTNELVPGDGGPEPEPTIIGYIIRGLEWMIKFFEKSSFADAEPHQHELVSHLAFLECIERQFRNKDVEISTGSIGRRLLCLALSHACQHLASLVVPLQPEISWPALSCLRGLLDRFMAWLREKVQGLLETHDEARRLFIMMDLVVAIILGLIDDGALCHPRGLDSLEEEFQAWLQKHGAADMTYAVDKSAVMRGLYDLVFAYEDGDSHRPNFETAVALRSLFRMTLCYKGAIFWKMQAGMGDTIFAPAYMVLRDRGVNFAFFHRVENLALSPDKSSVSEIRVSRQVLLKDQSKDYVPIKFIDGVPCWPAQPFYDQIENGDELCEGGFNLESFWTTWKNAETLTLKAGVNFDTVILGISIGSLQYLCSELIAVSERWQHMTANVQTVRTMAFQFWLTKSIAELGWREQSPVLDAYVEPLNTWADMSHLIPRENWPVSNKPRSIAYFCGQMSEDISSTDATAKVRNIAQKFSDSDLLRLWPNAANDRNFNRDLLIPICDSGESGQARFNSQYYRANIDPSERYVMSTAGSTRFRLRPDQSGFDNLVLAGDWTNNGFNAGCVEAAVMSGMEAANAVAGRPLTEGVSGLPAWYSGEASVP